MKTYTIMVILQKDYKVSDISQANKMFQQDKSLFHPTWKIKNEMFLKEDLEKEKHSIENVDMGIELELGAKQLGEEE